MLGGTAVEVAEGWEQEGGGGGMEWYCRNRPG